MWLHTPSEPVQAAQMKSYLKLAVVVALLFTLVTSYAAEPPGAKKQIEYEMPGAKEQADVDKANSVLDGVYRDLMSKAQDPKEKTSLREAQRAWIKWRDAEAMYIARHGGAIGGSGLRVDHAMAQLKLVNERIAMLKAYASQPPGD